MYIEDQQFNLPSIDNGVRQLGDLFDCRKCEKVGFNLFGRNLQKEEVSVSPISDVRYTLTHIKSTSDKIKSLEIDGSMSLDLICGLKFEGSTAYDSNETNACMTETLSCDYQYDGYQVDLVPSATHTIDENVKNKILNKEICATHVVKEVVIGGKLNAKITIRKKDVKEKQSIEGSCLGKLVYGTINSSVEAGMLDLDASSNFSKHITISSRPRIDGKQPSLIEEMFATIRKFTSVIDRQTHYTAWDAKIRGVPIRFVLVPIYQYLTKVKVERLYVKLEDNILERFKCLLLRLQDFSSAEYVQRQIISRDENTSFLLMNDQSDISQKVSIYGKQLRVNAKDVYQQAVSLLGKYRHGNVKPDELQRTLNEFEKSVNLYEVLEQINSFYEAAQKELTGMHYNDLSKSNHIQMFTDKAKKNEWFESKSGSKILLQTKGNQPEVLHKFNELSQKLCTFGFEVAVVAPSISNNFSLSIKLDNKIKEYQSDIGYILTILKCAVSRGADIEHDFVNLCSSMFCISLPIEPKDISDINNLIGNLDGYQNVYLAKSRLDLLTRLGDSCAELVFFIPIEAFETSSDAVSTLTTLRVKYSNVDWIVGPLLPNQLAGPMLLIFKGRSLLAACFDTVDLLHLDRILSNKKEATGDDLDYDFSILSTESYRDTFHEDRFEYVKELLTILNDTNALRQLTGAKFWNSLDLTVNEWARDTILMLQATAHYDHELFKRRLAAVVLRKVRNMSWDDAENEMKRCNDVHKLIVELEFQLKHQSPPVAQTSEIGSLIKYYENSEKSIGGEETIQQELLISMCPLFGSTDDELRQIQKFIRERRYRNAAAMVSRRKYGTKMCAFNTHMSLLHTIQSFQPLLDAVTKSGFIESVELWKNEKFLYLVRENLHSEMFVRHIVAHLNYTIPEYIPLQIKDVFEKISLENKDYEFPESIESVRDFYIFLDRISRLRGGPPSDFRSFLTSVIAKNENLRTELHQLDALPHWNFAESSFVKLWDDNDIDCVLTKLSHHQYDASPVHQPVAGIIVLEDGLNAQPDFPIPGNGVVHIREPFDIIFGESMNIIGNSDFVKITKLISKPTFNARSIRGYGVVMLPYLLQQTKLLGCDNLLAEELYQSMEGELSINDESEQTTGGSTDIFDAFVDGNETDNNCSSESKSPYTDTDYIPVSRLDCLTGLFNIADLTVAQDIVRNMAQFSMSMPLVIPNIDKNDTATFKFLLPFYVGLKIKWEQQHGAIAENYLFKSPFQLILAVRIGTPVQAGKSSILNQVLVCRKTKNMFASKSSPGNEFRPALSLPGSVEFIWMTEETADKTLWEAIRPHYYDRESSSVILLANLHGNVLEFEDTVKLLAPFTSASIVFVMPTKQSTRETMKADCDKFTEFVGKNKKIAFAVVDPFHNVNNNNIIRTNELSNENTLKKVRKLIQSTITSTDLTNDRTAVAPSPLFLQVKSIKTSEVLQLIEMVKQKGTRTIKKTLRLQRGFKSAQEGKSMWEGCNLLRDIIHLFCNVLCQPRNKRMDTLLHLECEVGALSSAQSKSLRNDILNQKNELRKTVFIEEQSTRTKLLKSVINSTQGELSNITLGLEHFYRELAQIYFINMSLRTPAQNKSFIFDAPARCAELLIDGHAIEILDGDACDLHSLWLMEVFEQVEKMKPKLKIFVVTILGLQSSGKSTLLNALFACRFAVSVGRCTRGLFARLLFLDDKVKNELNIGADAILLIDTEGLGAPELMNDPDSRKKDRKLATFAIGISSLTIINVLGEYMTDLTDILQIAIIAMARLEICGMSPDIMVVQHYLTERNAAASDTVIDSFSKALKNAIELIEQSNENIGIRSAKCLEKMFRRLHSNKLLKNFSPYKDGATANSPPSKQYQVDVQKLYNSILRDCQESDQIFDLGTNRPWHHLLEDFWTSVAKEDFAVNFKNLKELTEFITLSKLTAKFKEAVDWNFRHHGAAIEAHLNLKISTDPSASTNRKKILNEVKQHVNMMPEICFDKNFNKNSSPCDECRRVVEDETKLRNYVDSTAKQSKNETLETICAYKHDMKSSKVAYLTQKFDAMLIKNETCDEFDRSIDNVLKSKLENRQTNDSYADVEIESITEEIWISLKNIASCKQIVNMVESTINSEVKAIYKKRDMGVYHAYNDINENPFYKMRANAGKLYNTSLNDTQKRYLRDNATTLPQQIVENFPIESFDTAMVKALVVRVSDAIKDDVLNKFQLDFKVKLDGKFKSQYTADVLKGFKSHMIKLEKTWRKSNDPLEILKMKKDHYTTMIRTRLRHGFSYYGDGRILSEDVLKAINTESMKFANQSRVKHMLGVDWFTCSESIRFKFFRVLIDDIKSGNKKTGTEYFSNPQHYFKKWFQQKVDTNANNDIARKSFTETFEREYNVFKNTILNNNEKEILSKITEILSAAGIDYKPSSTFQEGLCKNLESFISGLLDGLKNVTANDSFDKMQLTPLCEDDIVLKRVGCIKSCKFCAAMCLGAHGHDKNANDTKMHHTLHQPAGLASTRNKFTKVLFGISCNVLVDSSTWYEGGVKTTWGAIKEKDWLYMQSSRKIEFGDLMIWFFKELQEEIAARTGSLPMPSDEFAKYGFNKIASIDAIVAAIESTLAGVKN